MRVIAEVYSARDVFCLTSKSNEAFPHILGEAMFRGMPCVTTDVGRESMQVRS